MRGLYLSNIDPQQSIGYMPKILGQVKGFNQLGWDMDLMCLNCESQVTLAHFPKQTVELQEPKIISPTRRNLLARRWSLLKAARNYVLEAKPDFLYLRYPRSEPLYLNFLAKLCQHFPELIVLSEYPTFPYDQEYKGTISQKDRLVFFLDRITRHYLKYFVNQAVSINYDYRIFGIETISIDNGINVSDYTPIASLPSSLDSINLIGVANVSPWHGYDRLIKGLGEYYRKYFNSGCKVMFHIVGAKDAYLNKLMTLVAEEKVDSYVTFQKPSQGEALDSLFVDCHLAIGVLGGHRKGLEVMSPLKNREYCARGIPFVFSHIDPDFPNDFKYCLQIASNEAPINIRNLIKFISELRDESDVVYNMRSYAHETLAWSIKLKPVKDYIDGQMCNPPCNKL